MEGQETIDMQPTVHTDKYDLYLGDCVSVMRHLDSDSIDCVVTSPPYGVAKEYETSDPAMQLGELLVLLDKSFEQFARIVKAGGYVFVNFGDNAFGKKIDKTETLTTIPMAVHYYPIGAKYGLELQATRIWRKRYSTMKFPFCLNTHPRPVFDYEHLWTWRKPDGTGKEVVRDHKISRRGVWATTPDDEANYSCERSILENHCAAFPLAIPANAITLYCEKGDTVLDPFMGSGTTGVAAVKAGVGFIGIEQNEEYYKFAEQRIRYAAMQEPLFTL